MHLAPSVCYTPYFLHQVSFAFIWVLTYDHSLLRIKGQGQNAVGGILSDGNSGSTTNQFTR